MRLHYRWRSLSFLKKMIKFLAKNHYQLQLELQKQSCHLIPGSNTLELEDQVAFSYEMYAFERSERVQTAPVLGHVILPLFLLAICSNAWRQYLQTSGISSNCMLNCPRYVGATQFVFMLSNFYWLDLHKTVLHQQIYDETSARIGLEIRAPLIQLRLLQVHVC